MEAWEQEKARMQKEWRRISRELSKAKNAARREHDLKVAAETRAHDAKIAMKGAVNGLATCERDARRYQLLRKIGVRIVGGAETWLHDQAIDRVIDAKIADEGRRPSITERMASRHPGVSNRRARAPGSDAHGIE